MPSFATPMPARPRISHFTPSWRGDRPAAIRAVAKKPAGRRFVDCNFQAAKSVRGYWVPINLHWGTARQNNYRFILSRAGVRRMTRAELRQPLSRWSAEQVLRWRRTRSAASESPQTYYTMARYAHQHGVTICAELKHVQFGTKALASTLVRHSRAANHPAWYMALFHMPGVAMKARAVRQAGGSFAVIFGTYRGDRARYARAHADWPMQPTRVW